MHARLIAFYLPQFHPIPENDQWWEPGFTEWTNVTKARPLFRGHYQPNLPSALGFYDLRLPEAREQQAELARTYGVAGFCYWHYWFGHGRRLLERPINEVITTGKPEFPFCFGWANETWTGIWHGEKNRILVEQTYPGKEDFINHFYKILPALTDPRYLKVSGKPMFVIYRPEAIPGHEVFLETWRQLAIKEGLPGLYFIGCRSESKEVPKALDGRTFHAPGNLINGHVYTTPNRFRAAIQGFLGIFLPTMKAKVLMRPTVFSYPRLVRYYSDAPLPRGQYPVVTPNWDNTPRCGIRGVVLDDATPEQYKILLSKALRQIDKHPSEEKIIFIKSWNEWAEGNFLEPGRRYGLGFLKATRSALMDA